MWFYSLKLNVSEDMFLLAKSNKMPLPDLYTDPEIFSNICGHYVNFLNFRRKMLVKLALLLTA